MQHTQDAEATIRQVFSDAARFAREMLAAGESGYVTINIDRGEMVAEKHSVKVGRKRRIPLGHGSLVEEIEGAR